jgi:outer membrane protein OmpA-like peptidoglycan-associated protein
VKNPTELSHLMIDTSKSSDINSKDELQELRHLILGKDQQDINPENISKVLPEAIHLSSVNNRNLTNSIVPTVEDAIKSSVDKDLNVLSEALFPVIGPATRKAVSSAIKNLTQSLNQGLENSLSPQSFKWRFEAYRTGKSFAEVVLLRTLLYQVEQVLLIHKETGLVLQMIESGNVETQDPDLVSAMLTAIQDFVKDSFSLKNGQFLGTLEFGDLTLWIEEGPSAVLACSIRGNAPQDLRIVLQKNLEQIHSLFNKQLTEFNGDSVAFEASIPYLEDCLQSQYKTKPEKKSPIIKMVLGLMLIGLGIWGGLTYYDQQKWSAYVQELEKQPGIIVLQNKRSNGKHHIVGMRDPLTISPIELLQGSGFKTSDVVSEWKPFISLEPKLIETRARFILNPPKQVTLSVDELGRLHLSGVAPQEWIKSMHLLAPSMMGVTQINESNLQSSEWLYFKALQQQVEQTVILFDIEKTQVEGDKAIQLESIVDKIKSLVKFAQILERKIEIQIQGFADSQGSVELNHSLSQDRAYSVRQALINKGINPILIKALSNNGTQVDRALKSPAALENSRKVTFKIISQ